MSKNKKTLTNRQLLVAIVRVAGTTYKVAPLAVFVQTIGSIVSAVLPLATAYFAALTTTALAEAYAGDSSAGDRALLCVGITAVLGVTMTAWKGLENYLTQLMRYKVETAMTDRMYEHFHQLEFWRYDDKKTADLYDKARRFAQFFPYIFDRLSSTVTQLIIMVAGIIALVMVNWWLGVIILMAIVPGIYIQLKLSRIQTDHWRKNIVGRRTISSIEWRIMQPGFIAELRLYGVVRYLLDLRMKLRDEDEKMRIDFERRFIWKRLGSDILEAIAEVVALIWTALQIINHAQPIGQFLFVQQVVSRAISGANSFVSGLASIDEDIANLFDYQEFMSLPVKQGGEIQQKVLPETITLKNVSFHYTNQERDVLHNISLEIPRGSHVAIVGENGAGKSTMVKIITGLYAPTKGKIMIDGIDLKKIDITSWHALLSVLQQDFMNYSFATAKDNIYFGNTSEGFNQERFDRALDMAEARTFLEKLPKGINNFVDPWMEDEDEAPGQQLSGGQWQRLALARNFYRDSPIIILDEPTSAIDALAESRIFSHLFAQKGKTILAISHRLTTIKNADIVYMMKDGKVVERGSVKELIAKKGDFYTMFESQIK